MLNMMRVLCNSSVYFFFEAICAVFFTKFDIVPNVEDALQFKYNNRTPSTQNRQRRLCG